VRDFGFRGEVVNSVDGPALPLGRLRGSGATGVGLPPSAGEVVRCCVGLLPAAGEVVLRCFLVVLFSAVASVVRDD